MSNTLPLSDVCQITVSISPVAAAAPTFNQGLIVGPSTHIPSAGGSNPRIRQYTALAGMSTDGFLTTDPEYIAASLYFGQSPAPQYLWIGRQDLTAISTVTVGAGGTAYQVNDILTVTQSGASLGQLQVVTVASGVITALAIIPGSQGTGYAIANGLATTGGHGTGATVNITAIGETPLQSLQACRNASGAWWACTVTDAVTADHSLIAAWIQSVSPAGCYFFTTSDTAVLNNTAGNVLATLQAATYNRAFGIYSTTQGGTFPNNAYSSAAVMGVAMGHNTGLATSYFTLKYKPLVGVSAEALTQSQVNTIEGLNGNVYVNYNNTYNWIEQGIMPNGQYLDEILALDMLVSDIQLSVVNVLVATPSVPLNNSGEAMIISATNAACVRSVTRGFVSPGIWSGVNILNLLTGDPMPKGYYCQHDSFLKQSASDRQARKGMPVYVSIIESGAMHSITIGIYVQR